MSLRLSCLAALAVATAAVSPALAVPEIGKPAPAFTATDSNGKRHSLSDFKGKTVVLEWTNPECPFVKKHYGSGNMQSLQKSAAANGVVWLTVNSGAAGKQGHLDAAAANASLRASDAAPTAYLLDASGTVGQAYAARTTPHMYVIDGSGSLAYMGAIDDKPTANPADIAQAKNYVTAALADMEAGRAVQVAQSKPYGCSVKY
jgi:hypothetical protein